MEPYATLVDLANLWRPLSEEEYERAKALLPVISDCLRFEAQKVGKDLDKMIAENGILKNIATSITVDVAARTLLTSTTSEPMVQTSEAALGYSFSGTYLVPGGGLFIKDTELARLGLKKQRYGVIDFL